VKYPELGPYQLQAAIAAVHAGASRVENTDWPQIAGVHRLLGRVAPNPMVTLNSAQRYLESRAAPLS